MTVLYLEAAAAFARRHGWEPQVGDAQGEAMAALIAEGWAPAEATRAEFVPVGAVRRRSFTQFLGTSRAGRFVKLFGDPKQSDDVVVYVRVAGALAEQVGP